jgi:hypothetical protein
MFITYYMKSDIKMKSLFKKCYVNEVYSYAIWGGGGGVLS